jgi:hypothetical protein
LKSLTLFALLGVFLRRYPLKEFNHGGIGMNNKLLSCLIAGALSATLALASPALARGGGGGGHGGGGGGMHGGGGGMHGGGMGGGMHFAAMGGSAHFGGPHFGHAGRFAFRDGRFHHRFNRFAFFGAPYYTYAAYDGCWRRVWTPYGLQWSNVCGDYGY